MDIDFTDGSEYLCHQYLPGPPATILPALGWHVTPFTAALDSELWMQNIPPMRLLLSSLALAAFVLASPALAQTIAPSVTSPRPAASAASVVRPTPKPRTPDDAVTPAIKDAPRHAEFLNRIKEGDIGLLFLGDSITDFWPRRGEWSWLKFAPYNPADFGISGDCTEHVLWRITNGELDGIKPKVTVIMIGTNNIGHYRDEKPEWAAAGVKKIVDTVHEKLPDTKVLLLAVFPRGFKASPERQKVDQINALIAALDDGKQTRYLDIGKSFLDANAELPPDIMPDKLHPTAKGYDIWYNAMHSLLDEMMK
jgi:lysophospholipase L1-like esterase